MKAFTRWIGRVACTALLGAGALAWADDLIVDGNLTVSSNLTVQGGLVATNGSVVFSGATVTGLDASCLSGLGSAARHDAADFASSAFYNMADGGGQLGPGTNANANSLQFRDWPLVLDGGNIPIERLTNALESAGGVPLNGDGSHLTGITPEQIGALPLRGGTVTNLAVVGQATLLNVVPQGDLSMGTFTNGTTLDWQLSMGSFTNGPPINVELHTLTYDWSVMSGNLNIDDATKSYQQAGHTGMSHPKKIVLVDEDGAAVECYLRGGILCED